MLWKTLKRAGFGFILGMSVGNLLACLFGNPTVVSASLLEKAGSLPAALLWQTLISGVLGAVSFAGTSLYDVDSWPLLRIAAVHYLIIEAAYMPVAFFLGWLETAAEALIWAACSAMTYLIIFFIMWLIYRRQVRELNDLNEKRKTNGDKQIGGAK